MAVSSVDELMAELADIAARFIEEEVDFRTSCEALEPIDRDKLERHFRQRLGQVARMQHDLSMARQRIKKAINTLTEIRLQQEFNSDRATLLQMRGRKG